VALTKSFVDRAGPGRTPDGRAKATLYWDDALPGFGLRVSVDGQVKSYVAQLRVAGRSVRTKIGRADRLTPKEARDEARKVLGKMQAGENPVAQRRQAKVAAVREKERGITLAEAWRLFERRLRDNSKRAKPTSEFTVRAYRRCIEVYLGPWLDRPLASITHKEVLARHEKLPAEISDGRYAQKQVKKAVRANPADRKSTANDVIKVFRAVYNHALRSHDLPPNPVRHVEWWEIEKHQPAIESTMLQAWWDAVGKIPNPVRRDYYRLVLLTSLRRETAAKIRWEHIDWQLKALSIPNENRKVATKYPLVLPLTDYLLDLLKARRAENAALVEQQLLPPDEGWVFPAFSERGYITEPRETLEGVPREINTMHALRRTFQTQATFAGAHPYAIDMFMDHALPNTIAALYFKPTTAERLRWLRPEMEKIHAYMMSWCRGVDPNGGKVLPFLQVVAARA
jgi:hypothetical protein